MVKIATSEQLSGYQETSQAGEQAPVFLKYAFTCALCFSWRDSLSTPDRIWQDPEDTFGFFFLEKG